MQHCRFPTLSLINKLSFLIQELFISPQNNAISSRDVLWAHFLSYIYNHTITLQHLRENCLSPPSFAHGTSMSSKLDEAPKWYLRKSSVFEVFVAQIAFPPFLQKKEANHCPAREFWAVDHEQAPCSNSIFMPAFTIHAAANRDTKAWKLNRNKNL